ncbi:Hsp70 family protein [Streptomyces sp. B22F1]|uniref:Hsp70 family protein n=1 Tax=Streptomyces sp. B22F1 TaxID=3153566 RepID=UPI00325ECDCC
MTARIGIDFGTANTVVARWDEARGCGVPIPLDGVDLTRDGARGVAQRVIPSLLAYHHDGDRRWLGAQVTGRPGLLSDPDVTVFQATKSNVTGRAVDIPRTVGGRRISGRDAATRFLGDVTALAVLAVGADDLEIVATAPVESFDTYRDWLVQEVGAGVGAARLRVVDEATAAAVGYRARMSVGDVFCVFDFGAGTLDISIVRVEEATGAGAGVRVVSKVGADIGGNHIDALLAEHAVAAAQLPTSDPVAYNRMFRALLASAETAKIALTGADRAVLDAVDPRGRTHRIPVTRAEFDHLLREADILGRVNRALRKALEGAAVRGYPSAELAGAFLVGGTSLIPAVQDLVRLHLDPGVLHLDRPLEAVATGAAGIAGGHELHDHIQHDYAIRHVDDRGGYEFEPLVPAGTPYPTAEPVKSITIRAVHHGQIRLGIAVYELTHATSRDAGADLEIVFDAHGGARTAAVTAQARQERATLWLNEDSPTFLVADPPAAVGTDRFRLDFRVDPQKRLTVSAFDIERRTWVLAEHPVVRLA